MHVDLLFNINIELRINIRDFPKRWRSLNVVSKYILPIQNMFGKIDPVIFNNSRYHRHIYMNTVVLNHIVSQFNVSQMKPNSPINEEKNWV